MVNTFRFSGTSSTELKRVLFSTFATPRFTWLFGWYPLFTDTQRMELEHLYFTLLMRVYRCQHWEDFVFSSMYNEKTLGDLCHAYWDKHTKALAITEDGFLLTEQMALNAHRSNRKEGDGRMMGLYRSKRFVPHMDVLGQALAWMASQETPDSIVARNSKEWACFALSPKSF